MEGEGAKKYYSIADYLELEAHSEQKHEFRDGIIVAMSGGTIPHNMICGNVFYALRDKKKKGCTVFNSDQRVYFDEINHYVYPDTSVVCGGIEVSGEDENAIINPVLIIEVLSDSTAAYDRGEKFRKYRSLPSFKEYILIDQEQPIVDTLFREDGKYWRMQTIVELGKKVPIYSLDIEILMEDIYSEVSGFKEPQFKLDLQ
ncbi:MAG: Uma2 family endonuclease [Lewinellaceae bacterium]|nr:Uma2 family endonuclease [Phaeodactylibacter sp.]MCB0614805.1 Uma2 family endonuclease [Phaeodactylibacter sp.]MCB9347692.1 Uma2 family endonuclease [Lewinellaceae bacterium]